MGADPRPVAGCAKIASPRSQFCLERFHERQEPVAAGLSQENNDLFDLLPRLVWQTAGLVDRRMNNGALHIDIRSAQIAHFLHGLRVSLGSRQLIALVGDTAGQNVRPTQ